MGKCSLTMISALCVFMAGCASVPATPYWSNLGWIDQLGASVQTQLAESRAVSNASGPVGNVAVGFTYSNGTLEDVHIIQSTGSSALDEAVIAAITKIQPPVARGPWSDTPHSFALALYVGSGWAALTHAIHSDIQQHVDYPVAAMLNGARGVVVARFDYVNGRVLNPRVTRSSGYADLDGSVIDELRSLKLPAPPFELRDRRLTFQSTICFNGQTLMCPRSAESVYYVAAAVTAQPCSEVAFRYQSGKITDVRLAKATQYPALDKLALRLVTQGEFPSPSGKLASGRSLMIPVCYTFNMQSLSKPSGSGGQDWILKDSPARHAVDLSFRQALEDVGSPRS